MQPQETNNVANHLVGANTAPRFDEEALRQARPVVPLGGRTSFRFTVSLSRTLSSFAFHPRGLTSLLVFALISGVGLGLLLNRHQPEQAPSTPAFVSQPTPDPAPILADWPPPTPVPQPQRKSEVKDDPSINVEEQSIPRDKGLKKGFKTLGKGALKVLKLPGKLK